MSLPCLYSYLDLLVVDVVVNLAGTGVEEVVDDEKREEGDILFYTSPTPVRPQNPTATIEVNSAYTRRVLERGICDRIGTRGLGGIDDDLASGFVSPVSVSICNISCKWMYLILIMYKWEAAYKMNIGREWAGLGRD